MRERPRLVGDDLFILLLFATGSSGFGFFHTFSAIDFLGTWCTGGIIEDRRLSASPQPHGWAGEVGGRLGAVRKVRRSTDSDTGQNTMALTRTDRPEGTGKYVSMFVVSLTAT